MQFRQARSNAHGGRHRRNERMPRRPTSTPCSRRSWRSSASRRRCPTLFYRDPYHAVRDKVQYGLYLGAADVNGKTCDALAFVEQDVDWQIWISTGPQLTA